MTIAVRAGSTADFRKAVVTALTEICPCNVVDIVANKVVFTSSGDCKCLCDRPAGNNLLSALSVWAETVTIKQSSGSGYDQNTNVLYWDDKEDELPFGNADMCGGYDILPSIMLAHELIHANHEEAGTFAYADIFEEEEYAAVRGENQIRLEMCWPPRVEYGGDVVPRYWWGNIDVSDPGGCTCPNPRDGFFPLSLHSRCFRELAMNCKSPIKGLENLGKIILFGYDRSPEFHHYYMRPSFEAFMREAEEAVQEAIRRADFQRRRNREWRTVEDLRERVAENEVGFVLEAVSLAGRYRVIAMWAEASDRDREIVLVTNIELRPGWAPVDPKGPSVGGAGEWVETRIPDDGGVRGQFEPDLPDFDAGVGGNAGMVGGTVQFLSAMKDGAMVETALYGYTHEFFDTEVEEPPQADLARWRAVNRAYELWTRVQIG